MYATQVQEFRAIAQQYIPDRKVPLLLGEYNINYSWQSGEQRQNTHIGAVWFASVLKHLATAGVDMATSWHLKDGIYGLIDPQNNLRPAATVFAWGIKYLTGKVVQAESNHPFVETLAVTQTNGERSLLLINKSAKSVRLSVEAMLDTNASESLKMFYLDANGLRSSDQATAEMKHKPPILTPYSLLLLRLPANRSSTIKQD
jgi:xylan 1,4-beta-xylosidase